MREQAAKLKQSLLANTHKEYVGNVVNWQTLDFGVILWESFEHEVGFQFAEDLIVAEVGVLWQVQDRLAGLTLIILIVEDLNNALPDEEHLLDVALVADDDLVLLEDAAEHVDDEFVGEAALTLVEEVVEGALELLEDAGVLDEVSLHLGSDLLVEVEFLNDEVEIIQEGLLDILPDIVVECGLYVERLIWLLDFLNPHVQRVQLLLDEIVKVVRGAENTGDRSHQEWEEGEAEELEQDWEDVLTLSLARVITVAYSCDDLKDPIKCKNVNRCIVLLRKIRVSLVNPRRRAIVAILADAILLLTKENEDASAAVADVDHVEDEGAETCQVVLSLFWVLLQQDRQKKLKRFRDPEEVNDSETLQEIKWEVLAAIDIEKRRHRGNHIKNKVSLDIVVTNWR